MTNALILAAGVGRRLGTSLRGEPKCLVRIGEHTVLDRMLGALAEAGIERTTIVVGHEAASLEAHAGNAVGRMPVSYVHNPDYREGSIVSLAHGLRGVGAGDLLILDADVLFHPEVLGRLVGSGARNCALLDGRVTGSGEEMILCANDGRIWDIVRRRAGEALVPPQGVAAYDAIGESVGFWKVGAQARVALQELTTSVLASGGRGREYESVFPALFARANFGFEHVDDLAWIEIDFPDDVERARNEILPRIEACT